MDFLDIRKKAKERAQARAAGEAARKERTPAAVASASGPGPGARSRRRSDHPAAPLPAPGSVVTDVDAIEGALAARLQGLPGPEDAPRDAPAAEDARFTTWRPGAGAPPVILPELDDGAPAADAHLAASAPPARPATPERAARPPVPPAPPAPGHVLGVVTVRGEVVAVVDPRRRLGLPCASLGEGEGKVVIVDAGEGSCGLLVDRVASVVRLRPGSIEPCPQGIAGQRSEFLAGIGRDGDRLFTLVDLAALLRRAPARAETPVGARRADVGA